jgi:nitrogen fixation protein FixH
MRWVIQIIVMLGDIALLFACFFVLKYVIFPVNIFMVYVTYQTWKGQVGFIAWTHSKQFLTNAKKYGL